MGLLKRYKQQADERSTISGKRDVLYRATKDPKLSQKKKSKLHTYINQKIADWQNRNNELYTPNPGEELFNWNGKVE